MLSSSRYFLSRDVNHLGILINQIIGPDLSLQYSERRLLPERSFISLIFFESIFYLFNKIFASDNPASLPLLQRIGKVPLHALRHKYFIFTNGFTMISAEIIKNGFVMNKGFPV